MLGRLVACIVLYLIAESPAQAVCSGASTQQEYREADIVVRARLVSEIDAWSDEPDAAFNAQWGNGAPVLLYGLQVLEVFKGAPGPRIRFFEERNSGAFYLDADKDYLLFLTYIRPHPGRAAGARGAMYVRYACGQSKIWTQVGAPELATLRGLSARR
ncbi:MAG TPA: hypothetical protein VIT45_10020 [Allosphingosinicella sp.]